MLIFIDDGKYCYRYGKYEIFIEKCGTFAILKIINKIQHKCYSLKINEDELNNDYYFQNIKNEYNVLELFGLSNIELFVILADNCIKKNKYNIKWFKMSSLNISIDNIKFTINVTPTIDLSFNLDMVGYI